MSVTYSPVHQQTSTVARPQAAPPAAPKPMRDLFAALRPRQWTKNLLVFGAMLGAGQVLDGRLFQVSSIAFLAFCAAASAGYLLNDVIDRRSDALHPTKCHRPIAAGRITPPMALLLSAFLATGALALAAGQSVQLAELIAGYLAMQTAYCLWLRQLEILDIVTVAAGFLLRAVAGGVATGIHLTPWFLAVVGFGALFVVAGKRASEIARGGGERAGGRRVARLYQTSFLRIVSMTTLGLTIATYCLWAFARYDAGEIWPALSVIPFAVAMLRYAQIIDAGEAEAPERTLLSDRLILGAGACWLILFATGAVRGPLPAQGREALNLAAFVVVTGAVLYTAWLLAVALRPRRLSELMVSAAVLAGAEILLLSLIVGGIPGGFAPMPIGTAAIVVAITVHAWMWRADHRLAARRGRRLLAAGMAHLPVVLRRHPLIAVIAAVALLQFGYRMVLIVMLPVVDWDGLMYHLIVPDMWILDRRIEHTPQSIWSDNYPLTGEVFMAWPGLFLRTMRFAAALQVASTLLAAVATMGIARRLGAKRQYALLAGLFLLSMPVLLAQVNSGLVDIPAAAFALAATCLTLGFTNTPRHTTPRRVFAQITVIGIALGLTIGIKSTNLVVAGVLGVVILLSAYRLWNQGRVVNWPTGSVTPHRFAATVAISLAVSTLAIGSYWYLRTWATHGSPFYPISILGFSGLGTLEQLFMAANTPWELRGQPLGWLGQVGRSLVADVHPDSVVSTHHRLGGVGLAWLPLVLPAAIAGAVVAMRRQTGNAVVAGAVGLAVIGFSPAPWWLRYVLTALAVGCAFAAVAASRLTRRWAALAVSTLLVLSLAGAWFATNQLAVVHTDERPWQATSPAAMARLAADPDRDRKVWPWYSYRGVDLMVPGTTLALAYPAPGPHLKPYEQTFLHPLVGTDLQHRVVVLDGDYADLATLRAKLATAHADYVLVHTEQPIAALVEADKVGFMRITTDADRVLGADIYQVGPIPECRRKSPTLSIQSGRSASGKVPISGQLLDGCGAPMRGSRIELWRGDGSLPQWTAEQRVKVVTSDGDARVTLTGTRLHGEDRFFLRWSGDASREPTASVAVVTSWGAAP